VRDRIKTMVILALVFVALLIGYVFTRAGADQQPQAAEETALEPLLSVNAEDIQAVSWTDEENKLKIQREGDYWVIREHEDLRAIKDTANEIADYLASMTPSRIVGKEGSLSSYGLENPQKSITTELSDGRTAGFYVGNKISSRGYYVCDDSGEVYIMSADLFKICSFSLADIVVKETVPVITDKSKLAIRTADGELLAEKIGALEKYTYTSHYVWFVNDDGNMLPLDSIKLEDLVSAVRAIRFTSIEASGADSDVIAVYGLDEPDIVFSLSGSTDSFSLLFNAAPDGSYYCMFEGSEMIYGTSNSVPDSIMKASDYSGLRPEDVYILDWSSVSSFDIILEGKTYRIEKTKDKDSSVIYTENGKQLSSEVMDALRAYMEEIETSGQYDGAQEAGTALISFVFYRDSAYFKTIDLSFLSYNDNYALERFNGEERQLVSIYAVEGVISLCKDFLGI